MARASATLCCLGAASRDNCLGERQTVNPNGGNEPGSLAVRLYRMRKAAGLTGDQLADLLGWGPAGRTKISKIENSKQSPTSEDISAWAHACEHPEMIEDLLD